MKGYGQFCPVAKASEIIGERWTPLVLRELVAGSRRFNDLRRGLPLMSPSLLAQRLRSLEQFGVIERRADAGRHLEYRLTPAGAELGPIIMQLGVWGRRWAQSGLRREDLDPALLMWDVHRRVVIDAFPPGRNVVLFELSDAPAKTRHWWLLVENGEVDLCLKDPGYEVHLQLVSDLRTFTRVWMGDLSVQAALRSRALRVFGDTSLKNHLPRWLGRSVFAEVRVPSAGRRLRFA